MPKVIEFLGYNPNANLGQTLGDKIRMYRKLKGLSHKRFCELLNVHASTVGAWENNESVPDSKKLHTLLLILETSL